MKYPGAHTQGPRLFNTRWLPPGEGVQDLLERNNWTPKHLGGKERGSSGCPKCPPPANYGGSIPSCSPGNVAPGPGGKVPRHQEKGAQNPFSPVGPSQGDKGKFLKNRGLVKNQRGILN